MDARMWDILDQMDAAPVVTAEHLGVALGVTPRTVRTIIARSRRHLQGAGASLESKPGQGYWLEVSDPASFAEFRARRGQQDGVPRTSAERERYLVELLLTASDYVKIDEVAERLYVSKKTVIHDLAAVEDVLREHNLLLDRKPYRSIKVVGSEFDVRHCLATSSAELRELLEPSVPLRSIVRDVLADEGMDISDVALRNVVLHVAIALSRVRAGNAMLSGTDEVGRFVTERELAVAGRLLHRAGEAAGVAFTEPERAYLALHLAGKRILRDARAAEELGVHADARELVDEMLKVADFNYNLGLGDDDDLRSSLTQHVVPMLVRVQFSMSLTNPILAQVKEGYPLAYLMASQACAAVQSRMGRPLSDDEVGYVALWFALSLQRRRRKPARKRVLIACTSGRGSARLLEYRYREEFADLIASVETCEAHKVASVDFSTIDIVFTTVPLAFTPPVPVHQVSSVLGSDDSARVRRALQRDRERSIRACFHPDLFLVGLTEETPEAIIGTMVDAVGARQELPGVFLRSVLRRERLSSTDFGNRVAMPHAEVAMLPETTVCVAVLDRPVHWVHNPVQVVFLVSISTHEGKDLHRFYGTLSKFLMSQRHVADLIARRDFDELMDVLSEIETNLEVHG